ncbi:MAG: tetratricopeptide (TPR) repeat protein [Litorivivens sp.]|jgi:tetratricopeptide (TPR) repeat protein
MKKLILPFLLCLPMMLLSISKDEAQSIFSKGNSAYEQDDFEGALAKYQELEGEFMSLELYYNLGNTYYKLKDFPHAILNYERAMKVNPRDEDVKVNLRIANLQTKDKIDSLPSLGVEDVMDNLVSTSSISRWTLATIICFFLSALLIVLYILQSGKAARRLYMLGSIVVLIVGVVCLSGGNSASNRINAQTEGIIMLAKVDVLNEPSGDQISFVLHEGTKVSIRQNRDNWLEISLANGNVGWVKVSELEAI